MRIKSICFLLFLLLGAFLSNAKAQSGYGYSYIEYDEPNQTVYAESGTILDYGFAYYYDPGIQGFLYKEGILAAQSEREIAQGYSGVVVWTEAAAEAGKNYRLHADHYVGAYWYYNTSGGPRFIDYYGLNNFLGTYSPPYSFGQGPTGYYSYRIYKVATTQVSIQVPRLAPQLTSIDTTGSPPGIEILTALRGSNLFGDSQSIQVTGSGITARIRENQLPNTIEVLEIILTIDENAERGDHQITLTVDGQTSNAVTFRVGDRSPVISNITPPEGNEGDQVPVTITGTGFGLNPLVQIDGFGVNPTITSATSTEIQGIFTIADSTYAGNRNVNIVSRGISGNGFILTPGNSNTSNSVGFEVKPIIVTIEPITTVEKNGIKSFNIRVENASSGNRTRFILRKITGTGDATFEDGSVEIVITGSVISRTLRIKGITESSEVNNFIVEPKLNNNPNPIPNVGKKFTVVSVSFEEASNCSGFDTLQSSSTPMQPFYLLVPQNGSNTMKASVVPVPATNNFLFQSATANALTTSPMNINNGTQTITVTSGNMLGDFDLNAVGGTSSMIANLLKIAVKKRIEKTVAFRVINEENDDVQKVQVGKRGTVCITRGGNNFRDTEPASDDQVNVNDEITPGTNGICDTTANSTNLSPQIGNVPDATSLQNYLNSTTWGKQSNIFFTVTKSPDIAINYDLNRDGKLEYADKSGIYTDAERSAISSLAKVSSADFTMYYVANPIKNFGVGAVTRRSTGEIWVGELRVGSLDYIAAHELGHALGRSGHSTNNSDLMYDTAQSNSPCYIRKPDWDLVNP